MAVKLVYTPSLHTKLLIEAEKTRAYKKRARKMDYTALVEPFDNHFISVNEPIHTDVGELSEPESRKHILLAKIT